MRRTSRGIADRPVLVLRDLHRRFGEREIIGGLNLSIEPGQRTALRGPNGSGKSTILRCIAGSVIPTSGTAMVAGHPAGSLRARDLVGTSFSQERSFYLRLNGKRNLIFYARVRGYGPRKAAREVSELERELELADIVSERVDRCSSGMVQQLAFARALLGAPKLLLLDEPTRSLDDAASTRLWAALDRRPKLAVLIATHRREDLEHCDFQLKLPLAAGPDEYAA
jgi:ABC-2 type transport system ATP-binding protein